MSEHATTHSDADITFKVKTSGDRIHTITLPESTKVGELKEKLASAEFEDVPKERQRLIYSGRVMKNDDALSVYKIKAGNTIHMVKSAASNPAPAPLAAAAAPPPPAVPHNMAAGTQADNLLAGLTGARFAGHANLPSVDIFGADGGMGAPPSEEQIAEYLANPAVAQSMTDALNNPTFIDMIIQSNPSLASLPNAREMLNSPLFRNMLANPESLRMAARMRRVIAGSAGASAFPAPGATDTTPPGAPAAGQRSNVYTGIGAAADPLVRAANLFALGGDQANPFAALFGPNPFGAPPTGGYAAAGATPGDTNARAHDAVNPLAALLGGTAEGFAAGTGNLGPADNRPPEERYAEQLRQLNDMGFYDFDRNVRALQRSGGSVQGAIEQLINDPA